MIRSGSATSLLILAFGLVVAICGCGDGASLPETVPVRGKVTYKGKPLTRGTVTFQSDQGSFAMGEIQPDGTFRLRTVGDRDGATLGHHRVAISAQDFDPSLTPGAPGYSPPRPLIPEKYGRPDTSGLEAEVRKDRTSFDFELKP